MKDPRPIGTILVATGLSPESVGGVQVARWLAGRLGAELHAAHVIEPVSEQTEKAIPGVAAATRAEARKGLEEYARSNGLEDSARLHVREGPPVEEILKVQREVGADLLVIGRYGKGGRKQVLGSIASRLVRRCPVNVLVVPPEFRGELSRIGVATDLEPGSDGALRRAVELAKDIGSGPAVLLNSFEVPPGYHAVVSWETAVRRLTEVHEARAAEALERAGLGRAGVRVVVGEGPASSKIPAMATGEGLDLLVVGTHGRSGTAMALLGHTTEKIIHAASCSVWAEKNPTMYQGFLDAVRELFRIKGSPGVPLVRPAPA